MGSLLFLFFLFYFFSNSKKLSRHFGKDFSAFIIVYCIWREKDNIPGYQLEFHFCKLHKGHIQPCKKKKLKKLNSWRVEYHLCLNIISKGLGNITSESGLSISNVTSITSAGQRSTICVICSVVIQSKEINGPF